MKNSLWDQVLKDAADPQRAAHGLESLLATEAAEVLAGITAEQAQVLAALWSGSTFLSDQLVAHPDWISAIEPEALKHPRRKQGLQRELASLVSPALSTADYAAALRGVRAFKQREMLRLAARDLAGLGVLAEVMLELSDVADVCLDAVWRVCWQQIGARCGYPYHQDAAGHWQRTAGCVLGLGKLGGQELNYSSDVDVLFVYSEEGNVFLEPPRKPKPPGSALTNHQFFNRLAEAFIAEVPRLTAEGALYRIDLRLRPEGDSGPLTRSLESYENYYAQWGQTWERMMLIKARVVGGDPALSAEFLEMVNPFRYPRSVNESVLSEVAAMKDRIENEVVRAGELDRNVKLGRGGIREIEFIAQAQQLLHGGRQPFLQGPQTLPCLAKLAQYDHLTRDETRSLSEAYVFLRNVEHRLQMENNLQTHTLPSPGPALTRLARLMGCARLAEFEAGRQRHTTTVRSIFDKLLKSDPAASQPLPFPTRFQGAEAEWKRLLTARGFRDSDKALRVLREFAEGPGYVHVSPRTSQLAFQLLPRLFRLLPEPAGEAKSPGLRPLTPSGTETTPRLSDPDRVVTRLDSFISAYGARSTLFELWNSNPALFELLLLLFDRSEFLAELAIRTPDLVDELVTSGRLRQRKTAGETLRDLRHGQRDADQCLWLRRYHQAELMRIGLRDILNLADFEQHLTELSALADACLQYALEVVLRRHRLTRPPFAILGLGKLGGAEIDYGSDLDIIFVAGPAAKDLTKLAQLARETLELVSQRTEQGMLFQTDARLRPDGEKGLLVKTLPGYEEYYRQRAQLWEIQALTRTRPVAGDMKIAAVFQALAARLTNFHSPNLPLAAYAPDWKQQIHRMRMRIEKERTPPGQDAFAIKTGRGGLVDAEFIAQALCLEHGWQEPNTLGALARARAAAVLPEADKLITHYRHLRRIEGLLRRWSYEGETVLPEDPAPYYRVSVRCGFPNPEAFCSDLAECRQAIREVYLGAFPDPPLAPAPNRGKLAA